MVGLGWTEMLVLGVMALIVIGPKELPDLMRKLGRFSASVRRLGSDFQRELNRTTGLDEVRNLRTSITQPLKATTDAIRKEFNATTADGKVKPSGALAPSKPESESVVDEIHAAAGMKPKTPAEAMKEAVTKGVAASSPIAAVAARETVAGEPASPAKPRKPAKRPADGDAAKEASEAAPPKPRRKAPRKAEGKGAPEAVPVGAAKRAAARSPASKPAAVKPATATTGAAAKKKPSSSTKKHSAPAEAGATTAAATKPTRRRPAAKKA